MSLIKQNREFLRANHFASTALFSYGVLSAGLLYLTVKHGGSFMYLAVIACMLEYAAYRIIGRSDGSTYVYLPVAKLLLTLVNYIVIGRLLRASGKDTIFCVRTQIVSFLLQFSGFVTIFIQPLIGICMGLSGGSIGFPRGHVDEWILALLAKNIPFAFTLCTVAFKFEMWEIPELRKTFYCLFSSTGLIFISDIYHIFAGFGGDANSYISTNEVPFIILEMTTMLICFTLFTVFHYGKVTPVEFLRGYGRNAPLFGITGREYKPANLLLPKL